MTSLLTRLSAAIVLTVALPVPARAAYVLSVVDAQTGSSRGVTTTGTTLHLALRLTGSGEFDSFAVEVGVETFFSLFDIPPFLPNYALAPGRLNQVGRPLFVTQGPNDFSNPTSGYFTALTEEFNTYWDGRGFLVTFDMVDLGPGQFLLTGDRLFLSRVRQCRCLARHTVCVVHRDSRARDHPAPRSWYGRCRPTRETQRGKRIVNRSASIPVLLAASVAVTVFSTAHAEYVISVLDAETGLSNGQAAPGDTLHLAIQLEGAGNLDSFGVYVRAMPEAILFTDTYALAPDRPDLFVVRGANDFSEPENGYFAALTEVANTHWNGNGYLVTFDAIVDPATTPKRRSSRFSTLSITSIASGTSAGCLPASRSSSPLSPSRPPWRFWASAVCLRPRDARHDATRLD